MIVFKFGGASLVSADAIRNLKRILDSYDDNIIVVVSAMGKMTNELEKLAEQSFAGGSTENQYNLIKEFHLNIIDKLFQNKEHKIYTNIETVFNNLKSIINNHKPVLNPIGNKQVCKGKTLGFTVSGSDSDGDSLTYSASGLPSGASFSNQHFSWTPSSVGNYYVTLYC
jgi:aspartate kinase